MIKNKEKKQENGIKFLSFFIYTMKSKLKELFFSYRKKRWKYRHECIETWKWKSNRWWKGHKRDRENVNDYEKSISSLDIFMKIKYRDKHF